MATGTSRKKVLTNRKFQWQYWGGTVCTWIILIATLVLASLAFHESKEGNNAVRRISFGTNGADDYCPDHSGPCKRALYNTHIHACSSEDFPDGYSCASECFIGAAECSVGMCSGTSPKGQCQVDANCTAFAPNLFTGPSEELCIDGFCVWLAGNASILNHDTECSNTFAGKICLANIAGDPDEECFSTDSFCEIDTDPAKKKRSISGSGRRMPIRDRVKEELYQRASGSGVQKRGAVLDSLDNTCFYYRTASAPDAPFTVSPTI